MNAIAKNLQGFFLKRLILLLVGVVLTACSTSTANESVVESTPTLTSLTSENAENPETPTALDPSEKIIRITTGEYPPYLSADFENQGLWAQICREAFAAVGVKAEIEFFPWGRAYEFAYEEEWDATLGWFLSQDRLEDFYYSNALASSDFTFFHLKSEDFDWETVADLRGIPIGGILEYTYPPEFMEAVESGDIQVEWVTEDEQNLKKLLAGRINITPIDKRTGYYLLEKNFTLEEKEQVTTHARPLLVAPIYLLFSRNNEQSEDWLELFNEGLLKLQESGRYDQILADDPFGD